MPHDITARDLIQVRDFGRPDNGAAGDLPFSISPDGKWAALILRQADPDSDSYCTGVVLVALDGKAPPRLLDVGGDLMLMAHDLRGVPDIVNGSPAGITPAWSLDGRRLAYLRRDAGLTRAWVVGLDGTPARAITRLSSDVREMAWTADGRGLKVTARPALAKGQAAIEAEGRSGFRYDRRFWPLSDDRPRPPAPLPVEVTVVDSETGATIALPVKPSVPERKNAVLPANVLLHTRSTQGAWAWTAQDDPAMPYSAAPLHVAVGGTTLPCGDAICGERVAALWWIDRQDLLFLRGGGPDNGGRDILYRWRIGAAGGPVPVFGTTDALVGCQWLAKSLICARETATHPRTIIRLDPFAGSIRDLFDPNPEFSGIWSGKVERIAWKDKAGVPAYGDLMVPSDHRPGERLPLVVVQYNSRGFLRGGTGDDYPIPLLAARGFAVLAVQRPPLLPDARKARDQAGFQRVNIKDWAERRMLVESLNAGVDAVIARGIADPARLGITGLSDGSVTAAYILVNSNRFKAAAISSCCDDAGTALSAAGLGYRDDVISWGYPPPDRPDPRFWRGYSLAANADRVRAPLLIQVPDGEYRLALETYSALQYAGAPVDMFVFPDEHHVKWHPAHRLAVYERSVAWFDFWLKDRLPTAGRLRLEAQRWAAMKVRSGPP